MDTTTELPEFEDVYAEVIYFDEGKVIYPDLVYDREYDLTVEIIGNYESKNGIRSLENGERITIHVRESGKTKPDVPKEHEIVKINGYFNPFDSFEVESVEETDLPFSLQRYHNPVLFWSLIVGAVVIIVVLVVLLIRLLKRKKRESIPNSEHGTPNSDK
jgi:hypothetical protein